MKTVIVDIDGTISKVGDRIKFLQQSPKDWDSFYNACFDDEPIQEVLDLVTQLDAYYVIVFCTGRRESTRQVTVDWINKYCNLWFKNSFYLLMRKDVDFRHDTIVKPELLEKDGIKLEDIAFVLEDRNSMVAKWREMGLICLQVAEGDF